MLLLTCAMFVLWLRIGGEEKEEKKKGRRCWLYRECGNFQAKTLVCCEENENSLMPLPSSWWYNNVQPQSTIHTREAKTSLETFFVNYSDDADAAKNTKMRRRNKQTTLRFIHWQRNVVAAIRWWHVSQRAEKTSNDLIFSRISLLLCTSKRH